MNWKSVVVALLALSAALRAHATDPKEILAQAKEAAGGGGSQRLPNHVK